MTYQNDLTNLPYQAGPTKVALPKLPKESYRMDFQETMPDLHSRAFLLQICLEASGGEAAASHTISGEYGEAGAWEIADLFFNPKVYMGLNSH